MMGDWITRQTRGERNNNPGNIDFNTKITWVGQLGREIVPDGETYSPRFCRFDTPEHGIRAIAKILRTYIHEHDCKTVSDFITRWAPPTGPEDRADVPENDTKSYIDAVLQSTGFSAGRVIQDDAEDIGALTHAIIRQENGGVPYTPEQIADGVGMAFA